MAFDDDKTIDADVSEIERRKLVQDIADRGWSATQRLRRTNRENVQFREAVTNRPDPLDLGAAAQAELSGMVDQEYEDGRKYLQALYDIFGKSRTAQAEYGQTFLGPDTDRMVTAANSALSEYEQALAAQEYARAAAARGRSRGGSGRGGTRGDGALSLPGSVGGAQGEEGAGPTDWWAGEDSLTPRLGTDVTEAAGAPTPAGVTEDAYSLANNAVIYVFDRGGGLNAALADAEIAMRDAGYDNSTIARTISALRSAWAGTFAEASPDRLHPRDEVIVDDYGGYDPSTGQVIVPPGASSPRPPARGGFPRGGGGR